VAINEHLRRLVSKSKGKKTGLFSEQSNKGTLFEHFFAGAQMAEIAIIACR